MLNLLIKGGTEKMEILEKVYNNVLSELKEPSKNTIDSVISRRLMVSKEEAAKIREEITKTFDEYNKAGEPLEFSGTFREKVALSITLLVGEKIKSLKGISPKEAAVITSYTVDTARDSSNYERAKEKALKTGIVSEELLSSISNKLNFLTQEEKEKREDPIYSFIEDTIKLFDKYRDKLVINYEGTIDKVLSELFPDISEESKTEIEKEVRSFFESERIIKKPLSFVNDRDIDELFRGIVAYDGKGVRIPSKEERILLGLIVYKHFEQFRESTLSVKDRLVLTALIGDILYLIWLTKNNFTNLEKLKSNLKEILAYGLSEAEDRKAVLELLKVYLFPVWGALEETTSVVENLAEEKLDRASEDYALKVFFGSKENYDKTKEVFSDFLESAVKERPKNREEWLEKKFKEYPEIWKNEEELKDAVRIIVKGEEEEKKKESGTLSVREKPKEEHKIKEGISSLEKAITYTSEIEQVAWTSRIDRAIEHGNEVLKSYETHKESYGFHGELAEEWHVQTFNIDSAVKGKKHQAVVFGRNTKNSVDIGIFDGNTGKLAKRYQSKYGKDAKTTASYLEKGDYRGQRALVPSDQVDEVTKIRTSKGKSPATDRLEYDGVTSKPLSREEADRLKEKVKSREKVFNWKENVTYKEAFKKIGKDSAKIFATTLLMRGIYRLGRGILSSKTTLKEELKKFLKEDVKEAFIPTLKVAIAGATVVAARKGLIKFLEKTPAGRIVAGVEMAFRNVSVIKKMWNGELSFKEGMKEITKNSAGVIGGLSGAAVGAAIGSAVPIVGTAIGAMVGGIIGEIGGKKIAEKAVSAAKTIKEKASTAYNKVKNVVKNTFKKAISSLKSIFA
jgi:uncharacterized protein YcfJ